MEEEEKKVMAKKEKEYQMVVDKCKIYEEELNKR